MSRVDERTELVITTPMHIIRRGEKAEAVWLSDHGFAGLACLAEECGCWIGDLYPCGDRGDQYTCVAGYDDGRAIRPGPRAPR